MAKRAPKVVPKKTQKKHQASFLLQTDRKEMGLKNLPTWTDIGLAPIGYFAYIIFGFSIISHGLTPARLKMLDLAHF